MGGWAVARSPIPGTTITLERLKKRGYISLVEMYKPVSLQFNEPLLTACPEFIEGRSVGAVVPILGINSESFSLLVNTGRAGYSISGWHS